MKPILVSVALAAVVASCVYHEAAGPNAITTVPEIAGRPKRSRRESMTPIPRTSRKQR